MGRGLSQQQKQILGLAARIAEVHGEPVGRGKEYRGKIYRRDEEVEKGLVMKTATFPDITNPICVHLIWEIPIVDEIEYSHPRASYEVTAGNPGNFDNTDPRVKPAKVAASKALRRLVSRGLLASRLTPDGWVRDYLLTAQGLEVGQDHKPSLSRKQVSAWFSKRGDCHYLEFRPALNHRVCS